MSHQIVAPSLVPSARVALGTHADDVVRYHPWDQATQATSWARQEGCERVILTGPEPLLHPALPEIVATYAGHGFEVWIETLGLGLQKEGPLRTLVSRGLAGVRWLHLPASAAPYQTYLRKVSLSAFVTRTERVLSRSRLPVTHVFVVGAEPAAETRERMSMVRRPPPRSRAHWVTSRVVLQEAWSGWLGLEARATDSLGPVDAQLTRIAPLETTDRFRVFTDNASDNSAAQFEMDFPFCTLEQSETPTGPRHELLLRVTGRCNQRCSFCSGPSSLPEPELKQLRACLDRVGSVFPEVTVMLTGGEPLLRPDLAELVNAALSHKGIATVMIQTNAVGLKRVVEIAPSPRLHFFVSLHGATDDVYDRCTGTQGLLASALKGIRQLLTQGHPVIINCVVNRFNVDHLDAVVRAVAALTTAGTIESLHFSILMCPEHRPQAQELLVPYPKVAAQLVQAREQAQKLGIRVAPLVSSTHASIPACLVAPAHRRQTEARPVPGPQETGLPDEGRRWVKAEICARCQEDPWCLGLPRPYYLRFGDGELRPIKPG